MFGILDGIRIVEWAQWHAAPAGASMLGDLGAEVIKIERPKVGDESRYLAGPLARPENRIGDTSSIYFERANRSKRSITLDLSKEEGKQIAYKLIQTADVFIQSFRAGVAERMSMDYKTLSQHSPKLVYCNVNTYGPFGPDAGSRGTDIMGSARSGMMTLPATKDGEPLGFNEAVIDQLACMMTAYAISTALLAKERHGIGQEIDVSLMGTGVVVNHIRICEWSMTGGKPTRQTGGTISNPLRNHYKCKDGKWLALGNTAPNIVWPDNCSALGIEHLQSDPRFENPAKREENKEELIKIIGEVIASKTRAEWLEIIKPFRRIMHAPLNDIEDLYTDPQVIENKYIVEQEHPILGKIKVTGFPVNYRATPAAIQGPAPALGEYTEDLLTKLGYSQEDRNRFREEEIT